MIQIVNWNSHTISKLCLGTVQFGLDYGIANQSGEVSQNEVNDILEYVVSKGINCLDTGSMYGNSEEKIGSFIKIENGNTPYMISKIKSDFFQLDYKSSIEKVENSLNLLSISKLFVLLLHNVEVVKSWGKKNTTLINILKQESKIQYFGVSIYTDEEFNLALENDNVDIIQIPFNLLDQRAITKKWLSRAKSKNKLIFIRSVYLQGLILMDIHSIPSHLKGAERYLEIVEDVAKKLNISKNELALSFVNQMADSSILLFGCDNIEQARENIDNYNNLPVLDDETIQYLTGSLLKVEEYIYNPSKWSR